MRRSLKWVMGIVGGMAALCAGTALSDTYSGRLLRLWGPDVDDYRHLPTRVVAAGIPSPLTERSDRAWMRRIGFRYRGADLSDPAALDRFLTDNGTTAFLMLSGGALADERYFAGNNRDSLFKCFSMTTSLLSATFGIAQAEGLISSQDRLGRWVDGLDPDVASMPLQHLLDNTAGFYYERGNLPWKQQPRMYYTTDVRAYVRGAARLEHRPGALYVGEDLSPLLLGTALEQAIRRRYTGVTLSDYVSRRLWQPLGARYPALFTLDRPNDGLEKVESGFTARAVDLARFGQLLLDGGARDGRQIVPAAWVEASTTPPPEGAPNHFPHGFHRNLWWGRHRPGQTRTDFFANGHFGQRIYVSPDKDIVLVRLGSSSGNVDWTDFMATLATAWTGPAPLAAPHPEPHGTAH